MWQAATKKLNPRACKILVKRLAEVAAALNNEVTSLTSTKPAVAIKHLIQSLLEKGEKKFPSLVNVPYLYQPGELEGCVKRATDPIWSLKVYRIKRSKPNQPIFYYLHVGPKHGFLREELLGVPSSGWRELNVKLDWLDWHVSHRASPRVCHNKHSAPASVALKWSSAHAASWSLCWLPYPCCKPANIFSL